VIALVMFFRGVVEYDPVIKSQLAPSN
jgi:hypothetical protein